MSINEWMTLLEGLEKGLHHSSLTGFYELCRAVLVKNETDFDRLDQIFLEFFHDVPFKEEIPEELMDWLNHPTERLAQAIEELKAMGFSDEDLDEILKKLRERIEEQTEEHNGGNYWVGTSGRSPFGNSGWHPNGLRVGGTGQYRTAMAVAGERKFRDFRKDNKLDIRQFQMAFRTLRQLSYEMETAEEELDVDGTIRDTCDNAGTLKLRYRPPRKNTVKLLLFMDSGGSIEYYSGLCSMLFQAAHESNHFKELHTYYFHNCIYEEVFTHPYMRYDDRISTDYLLKNYGSEYKVIIVGDAQMNQSELWSPRYNWRTMTSIRETGVDWLKRMQSHFEHLVWLNPEPRPQYKNYWTETHLFLADMFPMYELSLDGLERAMKKLM